MALKDGYTVQVEGVRELDRALRRVDKEARKSLRDELKAAAGVVAVEAQSVARSKRLVATGKLVRSIKPGLQGAGAVVRVGATRNGYRYPAVYEFGRGGARAFLRPAAERKEGEVRERAEDAMQTAIRKAGLA